MPYSLWQDCNYTIADYYVIDGDTVNIEVAEERHPRQSHRIRLHGIDAPEKEQPYGPEATQYLRNMMANGPIYAYVTQEHDAYGRPVAILHRGNPDNSLNAQLVREGLAYAHYANDYQSAEHSARNARAGVWQQRNGGERPWDFRRQRPRQPQASGGCFSLIGSALALTCRLLIAIAIMAL